MPEIQKLSREPIRTPCDQSFDVDPFGFACYWNRGYRLIEPAKPILDGDLFIAKVGQQNILPGHLALKPRDLADTTIATEAGDLIGVVAPGLSGFLFFGDQSANQTDRDEIVTQFVGTKTAHKKTRIHVTQVKDILEAGWTPYYAPLINRSYSAYNPLHVLLCPNSILESGIRQDATETEKAALAKVFVRWSC